MREDVFVCRLLIGMSRQLGDANQISQKINLVATCCYLVAYSFNIGQPPCYQYTQQGRNASQQGFFSVRTQWQAVVLVARVGISHSRECKCKLTHNRIGRCKCFDTKPYLLAISIGIFSCKTDRSPSHGGVNDKIKYKVWNTKSIIGEKEVFV